jgi:hypothetical protein
MLLVDRGASKAPIILAADAPTANLDAAKDLALYIEKISGARPNLLTGNPDPTPASAIWVGAHPKLPALFPGARLDFDHPEEILNLCNGAHLLIAGRDRIAADKQTEFGTVNAIYTFIEKRLDVRWLWPGPLGEDILKRDTLSLPPFEFRFHPPFVTRHFWPRNPRDWQTRQRDYLYSCPFQGGHGFTDWWEKYHDAHPDWFALQPDGTRNVPAKNIHDAKLCISNPGVWKQWLDNAEGKFRADPTLLMVSACPNDGPWHCVCENCRAWDHPAAPKNVLTERHVKFWNILARGLRQRLPGRTAYVGALAYAAYLTPPVAEPLEPNIAIGHVGHFPLTSESNREQAKREWKQWADKATLMFYRPNLWYWAGGVWGFPEVAMNKTVEDFRFLAENKCVGIIVDSMRNVWSTQGPQYYLMAQLTYDPLQDGNAVMQDYYRRAFGPAAADIEAYWTLMEAAREQIIAAPEFDLGSRNRYKLPPIFARVYSAEWAARAARILDAADAKVAGSDLYRRRLAFVRTGFDYTRLMARTVPLMTRVRESGGKDKEAVRLAQETWQEIEEVAKDAAPYALHLKNLCAWIQGTGYQGGMQDYFGPPSEEYIKSSKEPAVRLAPATWAMVFSDDFNRPALGPDWKIVQGDWSLKEGALVSSGGTLLCARKFPGLHKVTFDAEAAPNPALSDISPFIQAGARGHAEGYLLQFGGHNNECSAIQRTGKLLRDNRTCRIVPGRAHSLAAEFDGQNVRLTVDGKTVLEYREFLPLIGPDHERVGFYVHEGVIKIRNLKVYNSPARPQSTPPNDGIGYE